MQDYMDVCKSVIMFGIAANFVMFLGWSFLGGGFEEGKYIFVAYKEEVIKTKYFIILQVGILLALITACVCVAITHEGIRNLQEGVKALEQAK